MEGKGGGEEDQQVLVADINIGYEDIVNTQVCPALFLLVKFGSVHVNLPSKFGDLQGDT